MAYRDLAIRLSVEAEHRFVASALEDGRPAASNSFEIRSDELRIIEQLRELKKAAAKPESQVSFHGQFGQMLYGKVLAGDLKSYFEKQLEGNGEGLRISLQFDDDADAKWLSNLPWEFLHDGEDFLGSPARYAHLSHAFQDEEGQLSAHGVGAAHAGHSLRSTG